MTLLIAEISNHHLGSVDKAKELILAAHNAGADIVKGQAFDAVDMTKSGSMPFGFYQQCAMPYGQIRHLIDWSALKGITLFFTIISKKFSYLAHVQKYRKIHATQFATIKPADLRDADGDNLFVSMGILRRDIYPLIRAKVMIATSYGEDIIPETFFNFRDALTSYFSDRQYAARKDFIGISHHGITAKNLLEIHATCQLPWVEKHFYLGDEIKWNGKIYRDCLHSFNPTQFAALAKALGK